MKVSAALSFTVHWGENLLRIFCYNFVLTRRGPRYYALFECGIMKCLLAFYRALSVWSCASFGTQLGNHPPGMIGPRLLGVDKSVSSIRVTVIKCFRGCTRLLAAAATTKIYVASVETRCRGGRWFAKSDVPRRLASNTQMSLSLSLSLIEIEAYNRLKNI